MNIDELLAQIDNSRRLFGQNVLATFQNPVEHFQNSLARYAQENLPSKVETQDAMSVMPGMGDAMREKVNALAMNAFNPAMTVWHGSPHLFDKFDIGKVGTGEGAQSYGHGIYVAESPGVAGHYKTAGNAAFPVVKIGGRVVTPEMSWRKGYGGDFGADAGDFWDLTGKQYGSVKGDMAKTLAMGGLKKDDPLHAMLDKLPADQFEVSKYPGFTYKVDLPDEHIAKMLDWDKPLSEQEAAMKQLGMTPQGLHQIKMIGGSDSVQGLLDYLASVHAHQNGQKGITEESKAWASQKLSEKGVPGIKYLDRASRGTGDGTRNFVVFDDKLLKILDRE